jgi:predicted enzyme related to lactoylglutathione lyase
MEIETYEHGVPSWVDLGTPDIAKAAAFYSALFGWTVNEGPPEAGGYSIATLRDRPRMAIFADQAGAVIGVWQPKEHKGAGIVNEPGTLVWNELMTTDVAAAKTFYNAVFGWGEVTHGEGAGAYTEFQVSGRSIAGMMEKPAEMPAEMPHFWVF